MYSKRREKLAASIIGARMKKDHWSRLYGQLVYRVHRNQISIEEIETLQNQLLQKGIYSKAEYSPKKYYLRITASNRNPGKTSPFVYGLLLLLTMITTSITGSNLLMQDPFEGWDALSKGFPYAFALLSILFTHEMGHYLMARRYKVNVTFPFFIPFYIPAFQPGTLGAFIRIKSPIPSKKALFDIGIAGPLAGFVVSILFLFIGLYRLPAEPDMWHFIESLHPLNSQGTIALTLGNNLFFKALTQVMGKAYLPMTEMYHFPFIFAGWFGLLVTAINLMPIGQLDGGHITYALFGQKAARIALAAFSLLVVLNIYLFTELNSVAYVLWMLLILIFIRFKHPPTLDDGPLLGRGRRILGYFSYIIFIICFSPLPIYIK